MSHFPLEFASELLSVASLIAAVASTWFARRSLALARELAARDEEDWIQRKWFDLYFKADEAYDLLKHFQTIYPGRTSIGWQSAEWAASWNELMAAIKRVHRMALVFPINPQIDRLIASTRDFNDPSEAASKDRLKTLFDAVEDLREQCKLNSRVLRQ